MLEPDDVFQIRAVDEDVLLAIRWVLSRCPQAASCGPEDLAELLYELRALPYRPLDHAVLASLEVLCIDGEVRQ